MVTAFVMPTKSRAVPRHLPATTTARPPTKTEAVSLPQVAKPAPEKQTELALSVDNDSDDDGVCDADEITGCTDPTACNYDANPTTDTDNTQCTYTDGVCDTCVDGSSWTTTAMATAL